MGKPTGFLEFERLSESYAPVTERLKHYKEFIRPLSDQDASTQGARCMDCGIPFCHNGCPVNNIIPDWNDLVYRNQWQAALNVLHSTNNFPEFTGRICPAPCEAACTLNINNNAVGIKSIEHAIIDKAWAEGWVKPQPPRTTTGKKVAIVGSGPAGLAAAQQLARAGHDVTVYEKNTRIGGLLRYGIPDFKLEKHLIDRRIEQMKGEGVKFKTGICIGALPDVNGVNNDAHENLPADKLLSQFDAVLLAAGSETPRDLPIAGREAKGVHFALEYLIAQNKEVAGDASNPINVKGKHVVVIGGGDTGSDCVGTANRQGAKSVTQIEVMPRPPEMEDKALVWPYWPLRLRTSSSHDEGCNRDWAISTKAFKVVDGELKALQCVRVEFKNGKLIEIPKSEFEIPADFAFLAMGFTQPVNSLLNAFGVSKDGRGNANAPTEGAQSYTSNAKNVFVAGDVRRGQSLIVWAIREGRQSARAIDAFLMGSSLLPR